MSFWMLDSGRHLRLSEPAADGPLANNLVFQQIANESPSLPFGMSVAFAQATYKKTFAEKKRTGHSKGTPDGKLTEHEAMKLRAWRNSRLQPG